MRHRRFAVACAFARLCGCAGGGASPSLPTQGQRLPAKSATLPLQITVPIKTELAIKRPQFVSPNTASIAVFVYAPGAQPPSTPTATANISAASPGCALNASASAITCTIDVTAPIGTAEVDVQDLSGQNGTGTVLASVTQSIAIESGMAPLAMTLDGTPSIIRLSLETPVLALGTAGTSVLDVDAYDASGALIVAPGAFTAPLSIASDSTVGLAFRGDARARRPPKLPSPMVDRIGTVRGSISPEAAAASPSGSIVEATLDIDPPQSVSFLAGSGNAFSISTIATTALDEPPQSTLRYSSSAFPNISTRLSTYLSNGSLRPQHQRFGGDVRLSGLSRRKYNRCRIV